MAEEIKRIHAEVSLDYGSPRVHRELLERGFTCSVNTVATTMRRCGLRARTRRKYRVVRTDSNHGLPVAPNRLNQRFFAEKPDMVWLTDITFIPTREGTTYLCTVEDLCSRRIVGWSASRSADTGLAMEALEQAIDLRAPAPGLIVHSDRGSQFASLAYQQRLSTEGLLQSMSRKGNCYDNAPMESFYRSFKVEEVHWKEYQTHEEAVRAIIDYIDRFYNRVRRHSSLGYVSPLEYETQRLYESQSAAC
jgi:transposase InsO family protein